MSGPDITIETPTTTFGPTEMQALASFKPTRPAAPAAAPARRAGPPGWLWGIGGLVLGTAVAASAVHFASRPSAPVATAATAGSAGALAADGPDVQQVTPLAVSPAQGAVTGSNVVDPANGQTAQSSAAGNAQQTTAARHSQNARSTSAGAGTAHRESTPAPAPVCAVCGVVESVETIHKEGEGTGAGAVAGGVVGGVVGNQFGRTARYVGAIGGAIAGHQIEKHVRSETLYRVHVRMEDGEFKTVTRAQTVAVGTHVTVQKGVLKVGHVAG